MYAVYVQLSDIVYAYYGIYCSCEVYCSADTEVLRFLRRKGKIPEEYYSFNAVI